VSDPSKGATHIKITKDIDSLDVQECIKHSVDVLKDGGVIVFPTETVYGLGADLNNAAACQKMLDIKKRDHSKQFSWHIGGLNQVQTVVDGLEVKYQALIQKFWPGPLTLICLNPGDQKTVGLRFPENSIFQQIACGLGRPLAGTSVNYSGAPSAYRVDQIDLEILEQVDLVIDTGPTPLQSDSTVLDISQGQPRLLREGFIKKAAIEHFIGLIDG